MKLSDPSRAEEVIGKINERRAKLPGQEDNVNFYIQRFSEYYLNGSFENGKPAGGRIKYVRIFSIVALFILLIACINFMNMATAKAATRSKEVGIRKVAGAQRRSLIIQFITESVIITFISMLFAIACVYLVLPMFNVLVAKHIVFTLSDSTLLISIVIIILVTGILAGSYPAFFLSSYRPVNVLKGTTSAALSGNALRKALVVFQFALTVILVASSIVVYKQVEYIRNKNLGYDRQSVLSFGLSGNLWREYEPFRNEALQLPGIKFISRSNQSLVQVQNQTSSVKWQGKPDNSQQFFRAVVVDYDFLETMGLNPLQGRLFSKANQDTSNFIITKHAADIMGFDDPIGQQISLWGNSGKVVGVVDDFHSRSLHEPIDPIVFLCRPEWTGTAYVRFEGIRTQEAITHLERTFKKYNPAYPFNYSFVDDDFEKLYNNEKVIGSIALGFTLMAIIISGLGLVGLAAFTAERKRKEISIRKTLGASISNIIGMMSKDFIQLCLLATIIGCPVAYFFMDKFLSNYAYHTPLSWSVFLITALAVMIIALLTVILQVTRAATANPVDALRNE